MSSILGWISIGILVILVMPYVLTRLNIRLFKTRNKSFFKVVKFLRGVHKPLGLLFVVVALLHGYLMLGTFRFHTGTVLYLIGALTVVTGGMFYRLRKKNVFMLHKVLALLTLVMFIIHFFFPYLFS